MKKIEKLTEEQMHKLIKRYFKLLGFKVLFCDGRCGRSGFDLVVQKELKRPLTVEIKKARRQKNGALVVDLVEPLRRNDDLIAIIVNSSYVLIEPMKQHLKCVSQTGIRTITELS